MEARREFPNQLEVLGFCKMAILTLAPVFSGEVQAGSLSVLSGRSLMEEICASSVRLNCLDSEQLSVIGTLERSEEWESFIRKLVDLENRVRQVTPTAHASGPKIANKAKSSLTEREEKIWQVIQRGSKGAQYCRELHNADLRPRKSWVNRGCPGTYPAAFSDPKWRQAVYGEKSKVAGKGKLANP
jgi:hypothetical protein